MGPLRPGDSVGTASLARWATAVAAVSLVSAGLLGGAFALHLGRQPFGAVVVLGWLGFFAWAGAAALAARRIWTDGPDELGPDLARAAVAAVPAALVAAPFAGWLAGRWADALGLPATLGVARLGVAAGGTVIGLAFGAALFVRRRRHGLQEL